MTEKPEPPIPREKLLTPLSDDETLTFAFTRRKKSSEGVLKFYLYSIETDSLVISAAETGNHSYVISVDGRNTTKIGDYTMGYIEPNTSTHSYIVRDFNNKEQMQISYIQKGQRANKDTRMLNVQLFTGGKVSQRMPTMVDHIPILKFPIKGETSIKNFIIEDASTESEQKRACFYFMKLSDDEHFFRISGPFSIFQGFALAITTMRSFGKE